MCLTLCLVQYACDIIIIMACVVHLQSLHVHQLSLHNNYSNEQSLLDNTSIYRARIEKFNLVPTLKINTMQL